MPAVTDSDRSYRSRIETSLSIFAHWLMRMLTGSCYRVTLEPHSEKLSTLWYRFVHFRPLNTQFYHSIYRRTAFSALPCPSPHSLSPAVQVNSLTHPARAQVSGRPNLPPLCCFSASYSGAVFARCAASSSVLEALQRASLGGIGS